MTTFVQACNDQRIANMALMNSTRSRYSVITFIKGQAATKSHYTGWGNANNAFRNVGGDTHIYDNMLRMCVRKK